MTENTAPGSWQQPATVYLIDPQHDADAFVSLVDQSIEDIGSRGDSAAGLLEDAQEVRELGLSRLDAGEKFLMALCWDADQAVITPVISEGFDENDTDAFEHVVSKIATDLQQSRCGRFELKYLNDHNPLLLFAIQSTLELKLLTLGSKETGVND